jgi:hypothetical protein
LENYHVGDGNESHMEHDEDTAVTAALERAAQARALLKTYPFNGQRYLDQSCWPALHWSEEDLAELRARAHDIARLRDGGFLDEQSFERLDLRKPKDDEEREACIEVADCILKKHFFPYSNTAPATIPKKLAVLSTGAFKAFDDRYVEANNAPFASFSATNPDKAEVMEQIARRYITSWLESQCILEARRAHTVASDAREAYGVDAFEHSFVDCKWRPKTPRTNGTVKRHSILIHGAPIHDVPRDLFPHVNPKVGIVNHGLFGLGLGLACQQDVKEGEWLLAATGRWIWEEDFDKEFAYKQLVNDKIRAAFSDMELLPGAEIYDIPARILHSCFETYHVQYDIYAHVARRELINKDDHVRCSTAQQFLATPGSRKKLANQRKEDLPQAIRQKQAGGLRKMMCLPKFTSRIRPIPDGGGRAFLSHAKDNPADIFALLNDGNEVSRAFFNVAHEHGTTYATDKPDNPGFEKAVICLRAAKHMRAGEEMFLDYSDIMRPENLQKELIEELSMILHHGGNLIALDKLMRRHQLIVAPQKTEDDEQNMESDDTEDDDDQMSVQDLENEDAPDCAMVPDGDSFLLDMPGGSKEFTSESEDLRCEVLKRLFEPASIVLAVDYGRNLEDEQTASPTTLDAAIRFAARLLPIRIDPIEHKCYIKSSDELMKERHVGFTFASAMADWKIADWYAHAISIQPLTAAVEDDIICGPVLFYCPCQRPDPPEKTDERSKRPGARSKQPSARSKKKVTEPIDQPIDEQFTVAAALPRNADYAHKVWVDSTCFQVVLGWHGSDDQRIAPENDNTKTIDIASYKAGDAELQFVLNDAIVYDEQRRTPYDSPSFLSARFNPPKATYFITNDNLPWLFNRYRQLLPQYYRGTFVVESNSTHEASASSSSHSLSVQDILDVTDSEDPIKRKDLTSLDPKTLWEILDDTPQTPSSTTRCTRIGSDPLVVDQHRFSGLTITGRALIEQLQDDRL